MLRHMSNRLRRRRCSTLLPHFIEDDTSGSTMAEIFEGPLTFSTETTGLNGFGISFTSCGPRHGALLIPHSVAA